MLTGWQNILCGCIGAPCLYYRRLFSFTSCVWPILGVTGRASGGSDSVPLGRKRVDPHTCPIPRRTASQACRSPQTDAGHGPPDARVFLGEVGKVEKGSPPSRKNSLLPLPSWWETTDAMVVLLKSPGLHHLWHIGIVEGESKR